MALQDALHAAQHLADTTGAEVSVRLASSADADTQDDHTAPDLVAGDLVVQPRVPREDAPRPEAPPPAATVGALGAWTVTIAVVLEAELASDDGVAVDQAVTALFANGPPADLHAAITRPDGTHRRVALKPLDVPRPTP